MWSIISHYLHKHLFIMGGGRAYYQWCLFCVVAWLLCCSIRLMMSGLICWWNSCGMECDSDVVVCWGYVVLVWWRFWCILWEVCSGDCVVLVCMVLVAWLLLFAWCVSVCLCWQCVWEGLGATVGVFGCVMVVWGLLVGWNGVW